MMAQSLMVGLFVLLLLVCTALSFVLSGMESGAFSLSRLRIRQMMRSGDKSATLLHEYLEDPENFLWTILVGNTLANLLGLGIVVTGYYQWFGQQPLLFTLFLAVTVFLFYNLVDLLPKMLFRQNATRLCLMMARPFRIIRTVLRPLVALAEMCAHLMLAWTGGTVYTGNLFGNRQEMRQVMQDSAKGFSSEERVMINRVLDMQHKLVRDVSIPLANAVTVSISDPVSKVLELAREHKLTRFPVWNRGKEPRRIVGVISLKRVLYLEQFDPNKKVNDYMTPALYLQEDMPLDQAMTSLKDKRHRLAIVTGRNRRELGIVSLQDVLKSIFGEVHL